MAARKFGDKFTKSLSRKFMGERKASNWMFPFAFHHFLWICPPLWYFRPEWRSSCRRSDKSAKKTHRMNNGWWKTFLCHHVSFTAIQAEADEKFMQMKNLTNEKGNSEIYLKTQRRVNAARVFSVYSYFAFEECLECFLPRNETGTEQRQVAC